MPKYQLKAITKYRILYENVRRRKKKKNLPYIWSGSLAKHVADTHDVSSVE